MAKELKTERFAMIVEKSFLADIDAWRAQQPDLPPRSEAIRRLVRQALDKS